MSDSTQMITSLETSIQKDAQEMTKLHGEFERKKADLAKAEALEKSIETEIKKKEYDLGMAGRKRSEIEGEINKMNSQINTLKQNGQKNEQKLRELQATIQQNMNKNH